MADEEQHDDETAAEAFARVEGELALLRRAVERLATERAELPEQPDYSETLGRMAKAINKLAERMDVLAERPGVSITPDGIARQIAAAGATVRAEDVRTIATARSSLDEAARRLNGLVASATTAQAQKRRLAWTAIGGMVLGMVLWAAFAGMVARAVPESWLWPERMAARTLRLDTWEASRRLAAVSKPEQWNAMIRGGLLMQENRAAIERCGREVAKASKSVRCTVTIEPERGG
jgi:hypothetical protein